jgi:hypothetical protein
MTGWNRALAAKEAMHRDEAFKLRTQRDTVLKTFEVVITDTVGHTGDVSQETMSHVLMDNAEKYIDLLKPFDERPAPTPPGPPPV